MCSQAIDGLDLSSFHLFMEAKAQTDRTQQKRGTKRSAEGRQARPVDLQDSAMPSCLPAIFRRSRRAPPSWLAEEEGTPNYYDPSVFAPPPPGTQASQREIDPGCSGNCGTYCYCGATVEERLETQKRTQARQSAQRVQEAERKIEEWQKSRTQAGQTERKKEDERLEIERKKEEDRKRRLEIVRELEQKHNRMRERAKDSGERERALALYLRFGGKCITCGGCAAKECTNGRCGNCCTDRSCKRHGDQLRERKEREEREERRRRQEWANQFHSTFPQLAEPNRTGRGRAELINDLKKTAVEDALIEEGAHEVLAEAVADEIFPFTKPKTTFAAICRVVLLGI